MRNREVNKIKADSEKITTNENGKEKDYNDPKSTTE